MSEAHSGEKRVGEAVTGGTRPSLVVMKFGGTSVEDAKAMLRTAAIVRGRRERGLKPVVVVSAMAKVTDQLLAAAAAAPGPRRRQRGSRTSGGGPGFG